MLHELQCTRCGASLDGVEGVAAKCRYCGAAFLVQGAPSADEVKETYVVSLAHVAPSNRARVAALLVLHAKVAPAVADETVAHTPCEVVELDSLAGANDVRRDLEAAGAEAKVITRRVAIPRPPVLPAATVILDSVGAKKLAVVKLLHDHIGLGLAEAKHLVESAPCVVAEAVEGGLAAALRDALAAVGATVRTK